MGGDEASGGGYVLGVGVVANVFQAKEEDSHTDY